MSTNENPVDSSAASDFSAKLHKFEKSSHGESIQMRDTDSAGKATYLKKPGASRLQSPMKASTSLEGATFQMELCSKVGSLPAKTSRYLSVHDSKVFHEPQCLITSSAGNVLEICEDVLDEISSIDKPCVIVAVAGLYRTGKSFLMNLLADKHTDKGFALGDTVQSKTKGIWVWCLAHPEKKDTVLILLDTEGLGDPEKGDPNHDNRIFTLATLLCSTIVYNMKGAFDQDAVKKLTFVSAISKHIRYGGRCDENNRLLQCVLPGFVLALRDFSLKLLKGDRKLTPDEYLKESLQIHTGKGDSFNKPLECIQKFFPNDKHKCFAFPFPVDVDSFDNLDSLTFQDLSKKFQNVASEFVSYIYRQEPKKLQVSKPVNGCMFATLTRQYVDTLAKGTVPDVDHAFLAVAKSENDRVQKECLEMFQSHMDRISLPTPAAKLVKQFKEARWSALKYMREHAVEDVANFVEKCSEMEIQLQWQEMQVQNYDAIEERCLKELSSSKSFRSLQTGLRDKTYEVIGGYRKFKEVVDMIKKEYEHALREYEYREIALTWNHFVERLHQEEIQILEKDDALSEEEKQREMNAHANSMKQMMQNMLKENQEASKNQKMALNKQQEELNAERKSQYKAHKQRVKTLHEDVAYLETNKEDQSKILHHVNALQEKRRKSREIEKKTVEGPMQRLMERIEELEKKERERKGKSMLARVWNAIRNP